MLMLKHSTALWCLLIMVGKGAKIWGQKFRSSKQAIIESSPKHSSNPLLVATLVIMNWVSNVQAWGPMFFIVVDVYKSHARTNTSQLCVVSFYLTHSDSVSKALMNIIKFCCCFFVWKGHWDPARIRIWVLWILVRCSYQLRHWRSGIGAEDKAYKLRDSP